LTRPLLVWLRDDLRLDDQPALRAAEGRPAIFLYIFDEKSPDLRPLGGAAKWWLAGSLEAFDASLRARGGRLDILRGAAGTLVPEVARACAASEVVWTRRYGGAEIALDAAIKRELAGIGVAARSFNGQLLREPWEVVNDAGQPVKVFTPFWRRHRALGPPPAPLPAPEHLEAAAWPAQAPPRASLEALGLRPTRPDWAGGLRATWRPGEAGAGERLSAFLAAAIQGYADRRDRPDGEHTSRLSPHLRFGEISPRRILASVEAAMAQGAIPARSGEKFLAEIGWREFSYSLLYAAPDLARRAWQPRFEAFPFRRDGAAFRAWAQGRTGYPIVDAGMRELWTTGYMHNRVRMIVASFLIKHLLLDWRDGEAWFWDTLCDADAANNPASWQWVAGSGADAAPYFRIFNPMLQGEKFDTDGVYVRRWVPELRALPSSAIHAPWQAPAAALAGAGVRLGETYPRPMVDHDFARQRALAALAEVNA